jgi:hypothetical protein
VTRAKAVAVVGRVNVLAPTAGDPYFRYTWRRADGTPGRTRGAKTFEDALVKARGIWR